MVEKLINLKNAIKYAEKNHSLKKGLKTTKYNF